MFFIRKMVHDQLIFILTLLISVNFCYNQLIPTNTHPLDIEIKPERVIINSTSITNFLCINHQSNGEQLEANLSKPIPINQMKLTKTFLNRTTINIRLESNNYVGIFHVTCHLKGEENKGNRADVIVKGPSGVLQLVERCRVYERQYTKCIIRAPVIASAIKNGFPEVFEFDEITHFSDSRAYLQRFEFLKNESTNENLVFKWKPAVEGVFPNGVRMHMKAMLRYFDPSSYYFDMTPIFVIKPKFIATALSRSEIQVNLTSISSAPFCEKSILPKITSNINQTWTVIEPERNSIVINNLVSNTIHRLCVKCRQLYTDPEGVEECVDVKTKSTFDVIEEYKWFPIIGILFLVSIIALIVFVWYRKRGVAYKPVTQQSSKSEIQKSTQNIYDLEQPETGEPTDSVNNHDRTLNIRDDTSKRIPNSGERYPHVADIGEAIGACDQQWLV